MNKNKQTKIAAVRTEKDIYHFTQDQKDASRKRRQEQRKAKGKNTVMHSEDN